MSQRQPNYQENKGQISTIYLIVQHSLKVRKSEDVTKLRENIVNATFLTMMRPNFQNESPLKNIYLTFEDPQSQEHIFEPELSQDGENQRPQPPFLQPKSENSPEYTLVLDLDETLGHFDQSIDKFNRRPFLNEFMQSIHGNFEIVIFTAGIQEYADQVLQDIDPDNIVQHRLYRHHTNFEQGNFIKDLTLLGRDLSKTIIVDNNHTNFKYQPENAIFIRTWINEEDDQELIYLKNLLQKIGKQKQEDLRQSLQQYRDYIVMQIARGVSNPEKKI
ncbi:HAD-like domain [Pseudocohnilembus persalinus]|uniref:Mitochondrial import inner membrane translocase subunit TIM50 n=1 Tax=Pseudocohnilembus persalinus TaxID=266149 RepID=A0A0V0QNH2_PSEPJ|nr:HAD-like domain [Pseudocohnilembus persalinus]|eukprot:KRX03741.1 HAD-like domain [Pseudocohnilembus persalinus]